FIWTLVHEIWICITCAVLYSNLVAFIVVAKYAHIKQQSLTYSIEDLLVRMGQSNRSKYQSIVHQQMILRASVQYSGFHQELSKYNSFWTVYLTIIFALYLVLISFFIYIIIYLQITDYLKATYTMVSSAHVNFLLILIYFCAAIVRRSERFSRKFHCAI